MKKNSLVFLIFVSAPVAAATYNFYFNNTEQGDNSTATPNLSVTTDAQGKAVDVQKSEIKKAENTPPPLQNSSLNPSGMPEVAPQQKEEPAPLPIPPAPPTPTTEYSVTHPSYLPQGPNENRERHWRFTLGPVYGRQNAPYSAPSGDESWGGALTLGWFPSEHFGLNFLFGTGERGLSNVSSGALPGFWGVELETIPLRLSLFGLSDLFEFGGEVGVSNIAVAPGNFASFHVGLRASLNVSKSFFLNTGIRGNVGFYFADAGLGFRF